MVSETKRQRAADSRLDLLFPAITSTNIHPTGVASFTFCGSHFLINGRYALGAKSIRITHRALIMTLCFGDLFLSQGVGWCNQ